MPFCRFGRAAVPALRAGSAWRRDDPLCDWRGRLRHHLRDIGWLLIASRAPLVHGLIVAAVLALGATVSLIKTVGDGHIWSRGGTNDDGSIGRLWGDTFAAAARR